MTNYRALHQFAEYFKGLEEHYVIIGGMATVLLLDRDYGLDGHAKATKDIDMVLLGRLVDEMADRIKSYVRDGGYQIRRKNEGQYSFYRFQKPNVDGFIHMLELLAPNSLELDLTEEQEIIPIDPGEKHSLSAIMLEDDYYNVISANIEEVDGIRITTTAATIMLKITAFTDLHKRGEDDWKKHRADIVRLGSTLTGEERIALQTDRMREDFLYFIEHMKIVPPRDLKQSLGPDNGKITVDDLLGVLYQVYVSVMDKA